MKIALFSEWFSILAKVSGLLAPYFAITGEEFGVNGTCR